jgi:anaerobic magnesium-protoporphyrin IX monomethyl ester cyclase
MKILLIEPPFERFIGQRCEWYPIGMVSIATMLVKHGYVTRVYNAEHDNSLGYINTEVYLKNYYKYREGLEDEGNAIWKEIRHTIKEFGPDIVGMSVRSVKVFSALKVAEICKSVNKEITVVAGGFHPTIRPASLLKSNDIDIVVRGEGEETFLRFVESLSDESVNLDQVNGISFKDSEGEFISTPDRILINDLDLLPIPKRELILGFEDYTAEQLGWIMTSRGCPYDCSFCNAKAMWTRKVRFSSLSKVMEELCYLKKVFKITNFTFMDDSFTVNRQRVLEFCKMLNDNENKITWSCLTRADLIDEDVISVMKAAGCTKVDIGIESGNERIQKIINKGIVLDDLRNVSRILRKNGIFWTGFFMMGFPTETKGEILETLAFMKEIKPSWAYLSVFTPYPGTNLYEMAKREGEIPDDSEHYYSHQSPDNCFSQNISPEEFKDLTQFMFNELNKYNNAASNLLKRALSRNYTRNPKLLLQDAKKVMSWLKN